MACVQLLVGEMASQEHYPKEIGYVACKVLVSSSEVMLQRAPNGINKGVRVCLAGD